MTSISSSSPSSSACKSHFSLLTLAQVPAVQSDLCLAVRRRVHSSSTVLISGRAKRSGGSRSVQCSGLIKLNQPPLSYSKRKALGLVNPTTNSLRQHVTLAGTLTGQEIKTMLTSTLLTLSIALAF